MDFHTSQDNRQPAVPASDDAQSAGLSFHFATHFHPYAEQLASRLLTNSVAGLQAADTDPVFDEKPLLTVGDYAPTDLVDPDRPVADIDFRPTGAYAIYNWELFYHVPLTVGIHLSRNQRYEEAQSWFHYIFDPTDNGDGPTPERFWKVKPLQATDVKLIEDTLLNLATHKDPALYQDTMASIAAWVKEPFNPHLVAGHRHTAYMYKAVFAYLDNLVTWGDSLFQQDTGEAVNEATQLYVLAANILGPRPQTVPRKGVVASTTYARLRQNLDAFGNALVDLETEMPFDNSPPPVQDGSADPLTVVRGIGSVLYYCIPRNDRMVGYWDTVADRLFKIRNSLSLSGVFRQLPLFEPPIDPALLARAAAAGLDVAAVVAGLNQPLPLVRFSLLVAKAQEICQQATSLGANLLSALEKEEGEALARLRATHERMVLQLGETVRYQQWQEATKARQGLEVTLANTIKRYTYYEQLLGRQPADVAVPEIDALDRAALAAAQYQQAEPAVPGPRVIDVHVANVALSPGRSGGRIMHPQELEEIKKLGAAHALHTVAAALDLSIGAAGLVPNISANVEPWGIGLSTSFGGSNLAAAMGAVSSSIKLVADQLTYEAGQAGRLAGYARREWEWAFQSNTAAGEIAQIYKQMRAAQIRESIAEREYANHQQQIVNAQEIETFLTDVVGGKRTNQEFYAWFKREVRGLYSQCFQLAFEVARKAERALQHELGDPGQVFLQTGYQSGLEGLLAGERLQLDLKRMEMAYHDLNHREYELTKHVSLRQLDPLALLRLRATGSATISLPEELFDLDCPGHYFRRIRSVAVTIPCVIGPYASVNCTLTLTRSSIRTTPGLANDGYPRNGEDSGGRFSDYHGSVQSIVTSTGQNDSGMFDTGTGDPRYLPFEGSGAVSEWRLELPVTLAQFDPDTIADVIVHLRYTAREGGQALRAAAVASLTTAVTQASAAGCVRLLSARHDFSTEWAQFTSVRLSGPNDLVPLTLTLQAEHYPFWSGMLKNLKPPRTLTLTRVDLIAQAAVRDVTVYKADDKNTVDVVLKTTNDTSLDGDPPHLTDPLPAAIGAFTRWFSDNTMDDIWVVLIWGGK